MGLRKSSWQYQTKEQKIALHQVEAYWMFRISWGEIWLHTPLFGFRFGILQRCSEIDAYTTELWFGWLPNFKPWAGEIGPPEGGLLYRHSFLRRWGTISRMYVDMMQFDRFQYVEGPLIGKLHILLLLWRYMNKSFSGLPGQRRLQP